MEFFSNISFAKNDQNWNDWSVLTFTLGTVARSYSIVELGRRLKIYYPDEVDSPFFVPFIDSVLSRSLKSILWTFRHYPRVYICKGRLRRVVLEPLSYA